MTRPIKFKARLLPINNIEPFVYGFYYATKEEGKTKHWINHDEVDGETVGQFTGLTDKNGMDVYEGDVVRHHKYGGDHTVEWLAESTGFFVGGQWPLTKLCISHIEVVGNVFETVNAPARDSGT